MKNALLIAGFLFTAYVSYKLGYDQGWKDCFDPISWEFFEAGWLDGYEQALTDMANYVQGVTTA
jgi:hypothetical protein